MYMYYYRMGWRIHKLVPLIRKIIKVRLCILKIYVEVENRL